MKLPVLDIIAGFADKRIAVIGDLMLDRFICGRTDRVSPEAPALVLTGERQTSMPGGACNVALNIASMGGTAIVVGLLGPDAAGAELEALMAETGGIETKLIRSPRRKTTEKIRLINPQFNTHLLRLDWDDARAADAEEAAALIAAAQEAIAGADAVILSDYLKGTLQAEVIAGLLPAARARGIPVVVDPKGRDFGKYRGASVIAPNLAELSAALGRQVPQEDEAVRAAAAALCAAVGVGTLVVKRSEKGVQMVRAGETIARFPTLAQRVVDVSGAGDTVVAGLALALAAGAAPEDAARIANAAAGVAVAKFGTANVSGAELREILLGRRPHAISPKIFAEHAALAAQVAAWQQAGLSVGFTNGCFDLLHPGHIYTLTEARNRVDRLVLALNTDRSVRALKGPERPIQNEAARCTVAAALEAVDAVTLFDTDTPLELIAQLKPNVLFKGGDYTPETVVGREVVEALGGRVEIIPYMPETSTTGIVGRIRAAQPGG